MEPLHAYIILFLIGMVAMFFVDRGGSPRPE